MIPWLFACTLCFLVYLIAKSVGTVPSLRTVWMFNKLPGPNDLPFFFGSAWHLFRINMDDVFPYIQKRLAEFGGMYACYFMGLPTVICSDPEVIEVILTSNKNIDKGPEYKFIGRWLANGILLSTGEKWRQRRKMLTPSFHFKILEDGMGCMSRGWRKTLEVLLATKGQPVDLQPILGKGALDIICESAMGYVLEDNDDRSNEYVAAVKRATRDSTKRVYNPLLKSDFIFDLTPLSRSHAKDLGILHGFTGKIIRERKAAFDEEKQLEYSDADGKKRQVFLDTLLEMSKKENLNDNDIREEVDTFMFAGHDSTSTALQFLMMHLAENPEVQEKAYKEQQEIFGYSDRDPTKEDLSKMHYLDQVIKESLRLHPPAPSIARLLCEDVQLPNGHIIPAGAKVLIYIILTHRNPKYWDDPDAFKPERFDPDLCKTRHPYSYIPFSAGPRNCIGQKFALLEMKIGVSTILRACKLTTTTNSRDLKYKMLIILQPSAPIKIAVFPRNQ
uniref:Cytochrome P450 4C18 n=1 Tax=Apolygus lucorum TaxID=248454 RepID=L7STW5_APOLU|nr:cytochrome P450 4C18 [Apolygus lucorum]